MQLQSQDAGHYPLFGLLVSHIDGDTAVDPVDHMISLGHDNIVVPVCLLDSRQDFVGITNRPDDVYFARGINDGFLAALSQNAPTTLLVKNPSIFFAGFQVCLVTADHPIA